MEFRILGPLEALDARGNSVPLAGARLRGLLALLLVHANEVVSRDRLIEELWGEEQPQNGPNSLHVLVSRLRRSLAADLVQSLPAGYLLRLEPERLDSHRFERLLASGRDALAGSDPEAASKRLVDALALWRGPALADFPYEPFAQAEIVRLTELRLVAHEERLEADLAIGRGPALVGELEALVAEHPLRERFRRQLMVALYRSGRQAEALAVYQEARRALAREFGLEPSPAMRALEKAILRQDATLSTPAAFVPSSAQPATSAPAAVLRADREVRKTVTVLFCDLEDSTGLGERLDPEVMRAIMSDYFETAAGVLDRHGALVEKFVGDAVMAVFGVPTVHEDDALRAVRAAKEMREQLAALSEELEPRWGARLAVRIGINTGEVVAGDGSGGRTLVTGDAVNTAARLEQRAGAGEIVIGEATRRLVSGAARVEPLTPFALKGKREAVTAWRLLEVLPGAMPFARHLEAPMVGREAELVQLRQAFTRAAREQTPHLFTLLGPAGIGKTRLAQELASEVASEARVLVGRCLSYGRGITFWPLRELVHEIAGEESREALLPLLGQEQDGELIVDRLTAALGHVETTSRPEEIFWAFRWLLEVLARPRPLVVVFEDVHWAEPTFLDLVEHLADFMSGPILILCLARPELLEERTSWGGGKLNATSMLLEPLKGEECDALIDNLESTTVDEATRARVKRAADGNPLFLEQLLAMLHEEGSLGDEGPLPPTIQALLAARLARLGPGERAYVERAAIVGKEFSPRAVVALLPEEARPSAQAHLQALVRKQLVRPERSTSLSEEGFGFRHVLVQHVAYRSIPKSLRAELHERFAAWLDDDAESAEVEEILGYHLEQAFRHRAELGLAGERDLDLARMAGERLASAGRRAFGRRDMPAAANLLERAVSLLPSDHPARLGALPDLGVSLRETGAFGRAEAVLSEAIETARIAGNREVEWHAIVNHSNMLMFAHPEQVDLESVSREATQAIDVFEELGDNVGLARGWLLMTDVHWMKGEAARAVEAEERAAEYAGRAGGLQEAAWLGLACLGWSMFYGPTPVSRALARCEELLRQAEADPAAQGILTVLLGSYKALQGNFDEARTQLAQGRAAARERGLKWWSGIAALLSGYVELLADDPRAAELDIRAGHAILGEIGDTWYGSIAGLDLARAAYAMGGLEEASHLIEPLRAAPAPPDLESRIKRPAMRALVLAGQGRLEEAEALAREAVLLAAGTDFLLFQGDTLMGLAEVLRQAGRAGEAATVLQQAVELYQEKGNLVGVEKARKTLAALS